MPREDLGTAYIRVRANTRGLAQQLRQEVQQSFRESGDNAGTAFNSSFERRIENLSNRLDRVVSDQGRSSGESFGDSFNRASTQRIQNVTRDLTRVVQPRMVSSGEESGRGFGRGFRRGFSLDFGPTNLVFDSFQQALIRLAPIITAVGEGIVGLSVQAAALTSSLASAVSSTVAFVPVFGAMVQGLSAGIIGFQGFGDAVSEGGAALDDLTPNAREAAQALRGLGDDWEDLQASVQEQLFDDFGASIQRIADAYLPSLQRGLSGSASIMSDFFSEFSRFAASERNVTDFNTVLDSQNVILSDLLDSVEPLASAFRDFYVELLPFAEDLADAIQRGSERLADFAAQGRESGAIEDFFERAFENAENLLAGLRDLTVGVVNFFAAGREEGGAMLETFADLSARFREFSQSVEGQAAFQQLFDFGAVSMERLASVLRVVGDLLGPAVELLRAMNAAIAPLLPAVEELAQTAGQLATDAFLPLLEIIGDVTSALSGPIASAARGLGAALEAIPGPVLATVAALAALRRLNIASVFLTAIGPFQRFGQQMAVQASLGAAAGQSITTLGAASATAGVRMGRAAAALRGVTSALGGPFVVAATAAITAVSALSDWLSQSDEELEEWANGLVEGLDAGDVEGQLEVYRQRLADVNAEAQNIGQEDILANVFLGWETGAVQAGEQADELRSRISELEEQERDAAEQQRESLAAIDGVTESQAAYAQQLGITQQELQDFASQARESIESFAEGAGQFTDVLGAWDTATENAARAAAENAGEGADAWEDFAADAEVSLSQFSEALDEQITAQRNWAENLGVLASRVPPEVLEHLASLGPEAAPLIQEMVDASGEELQQLVPKIQETMPAATNALSEELATWSQVAGRVAAIAGQDVADNIAREIRTGQTTVGEALDGIDLLLEERIPDEFTITPRMSTQDFDAETLTVQESINTLAGQRPTVTADLSPTPFNDALFGVNEQIGFLGNQVPTPTVDLAPTPFDETEQRVLGDIINLDAERPTPEADMTIAELIESNNRASNFLTNLDDQRPTPVADVNYTPLSQGVQIAQGVVESLTGKTVTAGAETRGLGGVSSLFDAINSLFDRTVTVTTEFVYQGTPPPQGIRRPGLANGGIVTSPQLTMIGENSDPEVVVPLTRPNRARQLAEESGLMDMLGPRSSGGAAAASGNQVTVMPGAVQFTAPVTNPQRAAEAVVDRLVIETTR